MKRLVKTAKEGLATVSVLAVIVLAGSSLLGCGEDEETSATSTSATPTAEANAQDTEDPNADTYDATSDPPDASIQIAMRGKAFQPANITARIGQTLVFTNEDQVAHKIDSNEGQRFTTKMLEVGDTFEYQIKPDENRRAMNFICTIHPAQMEGGVIVTN